MDQTFLNRLTSVVKADGMPLRILVSRQFPEFFGAFAIRYNRSAGGNSPERAVGSLICVMADLFDESQGEALRKWGPHSAITAWAIGKPFVCRNTEYNGLIERGLIDIHEIPYNIDEIYAREGLTRYDP